MLASPTVAQSNRNRGATSNVSQFLLPSRRNELPCDMLDISTNSPHKYNQSNAITPSPFATHDAVEPSSMPRVQQLARDHSKTATAWTTLDGNHRKTARGHCGSDDL